MPLLQRVLELATSIPLLANLPGAAFSVLFELQEHSLRCLTSVLFAFPEKINLQFKYEILNKIYLLLEMNHHKTEGNEMENASECL